MQEIPNKGEPYIADSTFCNKALCDNKACDKHPCRIPKTVPVEVAPLNAYGYCVKSLLTKTPSKGD